MFKRLDEDQAIVVTNGVFKPVDLYEYNGGLYAQVAGGFVRLRADGSTSHPKYRIECLNRDAPLWRDTFGRLRTMSAEGSKPIALTDEGTLAIGSEKT